MDKLLETIGALQEKQKAGGGGAITTLILVVLVLVAVAAMSYLAWKQSKELAELRHERDVAKEDAHQEAVRASVAALEEDKQQHLDAANAAMDRVDATRASIIDLAEQHARNVAIISKLKTWDDIDEYLASKNSADSKPGDQR